MIYALASAGLLAAVAVVAAWRAVWLHRLVFAALFEQGRREAELAAQKPPITITPAKRRRMIQQRLSRDLGKRAFGRRIADLITRVIA